MIDKNINNINEMNSISEKTKLRNEIYELAVSIDDKYIKKYENAGLIKDVIKINTYETINIIDICYSFEIGIKLI